MCIIIIIIIIFISSSSIISNGQRNAAGEDYPGFGSGIHGSGAPETEGTERGHVSGKPSPLGVLPHSHHHADKPPAVDADNQRICVAFGLPRLTASLLNSGF